MGDGVISHEKVVQCIYSFLRAHGYRNTLLALQIESRVPCNTIDVVDADSGGKDGPCVNPKLLERAVLEGRWDTVLHDYVDTLLLPEEVVFTLYELIFEELLTLGGFVHAARALLTSSPVFTKMKRSSAARYARLEQSLASFKSDAVGYDGGEGTDVVPKHLQEKRQAILKTLLEAISWNEKPYDGALPAALYRMFSAESHNGDSFLGGSHSVEDDGVAVGGINDVPPPSSCTTFLRYPLQCPQNVKSLKLPDDDGLSSCLVTSRALRGENEEEKGRLLTVVIGTANGMVDFLGGDCVSLPGKPMRHTDGVLCLAADVVSNGGATWIAAGYRDGWVKIYNVESKKLVRRFSQVHSGGVTAIVFAGARADELFGHRAYLISGSYDGSIQLLNILSGAAVQRISDAHESRYVLSLCVLASRPDDWCHIVSAGNNGTLSFWCLSGEQLKRVGYPRRLATIHADMRDDIPNRLLPVDDDGVTKEIVVITRSQYALILSACFTNNVAQPLDLTLHCTICTPQPLFSGCLTVVHTPAQLEPVMSLFLTGRDGTIMLYNIEMRWRVSNPVGTAKVSHPVDQSSIVIVELGKAAESLSVAYVPGGHGKLLAYSPLVSQTYLLSWGEAAQS